MPLDLFTKTSIPTALPTEMQALITELKKSPSQEDCLQKAYEMLIAKYQGNRLKTYTKLFEVFKYDVKTLWSKNGFLHCTNINYLLRTLLIKSDFFKEEGLRLKWTLIWFISPHQYLQAKINSEWINVDVWAHAFGIELGDYAYGFH